MKKLFFNIRQRDSMDCGSSCLVIVSRFYGQQVNQEQVRQACFPRQEWRFITRY